jgi:hypothetical protein
MAKNPSLTKEKLDLLAQILEEEIELTSPGVKTYSALQEMNHYLATRSVPVEQNINLSEERLLC